LFLNHELCDLYIGKGADKKLLEEIEHAQMSVKVLSPFLSPFLVKKLIDLHYRNIDVQLITTDTFEDFYDDRKCNIHELIQQRVRRDAEASNRRKQWKRTLPAGGLFPILFLGFIQFSNP